MKKKSKSILIFFIIIFVLLDLFIITDSFFILRLIDVDSYIKTKTTQRYETALPFDSKKDFIATVGCSYTHGDAITEEETFAYKLQQQTKRKTYNLGLSSHGIQHVLYIIENYPLFNDKEKNKVPKYVIYTFIPDHLRRMYVSRLNLNSIWRNQPYYVIGNNFYPKKQTINFVDYIEMSPLCMYITYNIFYNATEKERFDFLKLYLEKCNEELKKHRKDAQFVVLIYNPILDLHNEKPFKTNDWDELEKEGEKMLLKNDRWNELEKDGIKVIRLDNEKFAFLTEQEYIAKDNVHPSGKAWDKIVPVISKKLNL